MSETKEKVMPLEKMREPFPAHQISYIPKGGIKLAYVGHAALTDRLLDVDPAWTWEPLALDSMGYPAVDADGGMWIKLTVCGVTRLGYGDAQGKTGGNAVKERIGDALRNAAMRFGAALDLWHKGELHAPEEVAAGMTAEREETWRTSIKSQTTKAQAKAVWKEAIAECSALNDVEAGKRLKASLIVAAAALDAAEEGAE